MVASVQLLAIICISSEKHETSGSNIKSCIKIDKPLVVYRFSGNHMNYDVHYNVAYIMTFYNHCLLKNRDIGVIFMSYDK